MHYHNAIIDLLGISKHIQSSPRQELADWERQHGVFLPTAYREWCELNVGEALLRLFSNMDQFYLMSPDLRRDSIWGQYAQFMSENQNNFELAILLDGTPDPAVIFSWLDGKRVQYTLRFSDYVFVQLFDWQFQLEDADLDLLNSSAMTDLFNPVLHREKTFEVHYSDDILVQLSDLPNRGPSNTFYIKDETYVEHRFWTSSDARLRILIKESQETALVHTFGTESINSLYLDLKERLTDRITKVVWEPSASEPSAN